MSITLKITQVGDSLGVVLPREDEFMREYREAFHELAK